MSAATDRHAHCFFGWPCAIAATAAKGRHLIAVRNFAHGETVLVSEAYLTALLSSHKKRICAACLRDCGRRLRVHCSGCDEAWYCSEACRDAHATGAQAPGVPAQEQSVLRIPHSMLCPVLSHFGGLKADADTVCILRMCLDLLALQRLEAAGSKTEHRADSSQAVAEPAQAMPANGQLEKHVLSVQAASAAPVSGADCPGAGSHASAAASGEATAAGAPANGHAGDAAAASSCSSSSSDAQPAWPPLPPLRHADFSLLQCHSVSLSERDAQQWRRAMAFLLAALERSGWPQPLPSQATLMLWAGRIAANSFYCYSGGGGRAAPACRSWPQPPPPPPPPPHQQQQQQQQGLAQQQYGAGSCQQPSAGSQQRTSQRSLAVTQQAAGNAGGRQPGGASTSGAAARPTQAQQQAAASFNAQQQLRRLQIAQRQLWQGSADTNADVSAPHANGDADSSGNRLPAAGAVGGSAALDRLPSTSDASATGFHAPQSHAPADSEAGVSGQSAGQLEPQQQQEQPQQHNQQVRQGATGDGSSAATPCFAAAESASGTRLQPVGRELFITASYLNHSCQPNCIIHRQATISVITAQADIKAGDELCISYIDLELPRSARQAALTRMFHFACDCERCRQEEAEGSGKCSYSGSGGKGGKAGVPKRRGRKARISR